MVHSWRRVLFLTWFGFRPFRSRVRAVDTASRRHRLYFTDLYREAGASITRQVVPTTSPETAQDGPTGSHSAALGAARAPNSSTRCPPSSTPAAGVGRAATASSSTRWATHSGMGNPDDANGVTNGITERGNGTSGPLGALLPLPLTYPLGPTMTLVHVIYRRAKGEQEGMSKSVQEFKDVHARTCGDTNNAPSALGRDASVTVTLVAVALTPRRPEFR